MACRIFPDAWSNALLSPAAPAVAILPTIRVYPGSPHLHDNGAYRSCPCAAMREKLRPAPVTSTGDCIPHLILLTLQCVLDELRRLGGIWHLIAPGKAFKRAARVPGNAYIDACFCPKHNKKVSVSKVYHSAFFMSSVQGGEINFPLFYLPLIGSAYIWACLVLSKSLNNAVSFGFHLFSPAILWGLHIAQLCCFFFSRFLIIK